MRLLQYLALSARGLGREVVEAVREQLPGEVSDMARKTLAELFRAEGKVEGRAEGKAEMLRHLLSLRFGPLSPEVEARLDQADPPRLESWAARLLTAGSLDEVFAVSPG